DISPDRAAQHRWLSLEKFHAGAGSGRLPPIPCGKWQRPADLSRSESDSSRHPAVLFPVAGPRDDRRIMSRTEIECVPAPAIQTIPLLHRTVYTTSRVIRLNV